jgi:hypothetical protein
MNANAVNGLHILNSKNVYWNVYVKVYGLTKPSDKLADKMKHKARYVLVTNGLLKYHDLNYDTASYIFIRFYKW